MTMTRSMEANSRAGMVTDHQVGRRQEVQSRHRQEELHGKEIDSD